MTFFTRKSKSRSGRIFFVKMKSFEYFPIEYLVFGFFAQTAFIIAFEITVGFEAEPF